MKRLAFVLLLVPGLAVAEEFGPGIHIVTIGTAKVILTVPAGASVKIDLPTSQVTLTPKEPEEPTDPPPTGSTLDQFRKAVQDTPAPRNVQQRKAVAQLYESTRNKATSSIDLPAHRSNSCSRLHGQTRVRSTSFSSWSVTGLVWLEVNVSRST